jgi:DNA-binding transcriptional ArsR family regulator
MSSPIARLGSQSFGSETEPTVVAVGDTEGEAVLDALSSDTARELFCAVDDEPAPPSKLARRIDSSVQNVHYHLSNLQEAGLVHVVGNHYSEKGNEMDVYGVAADPIVLAADASPQERSTLRRLLADWATGVATIGLVSVAIQLLTTRLVGSGSGVFEPASPGLPDDAILPWLAEAVAAPGLLFFVGGVAVLTVAILAETVGE